MDFNEIIKVCAPNTDPNVLERIIKVESSLNPYAIGVVGGNLARQPKNKTEAIEMARALHNGGWNFSMGLGQINRYNIDKYNINYETVFDPCTNIRTTAFIYKECLERAMQKFEKDKAMLAAFSCYYSGNFERGFQNEDGGKKSYVQRILDVDTLTYSRTLKSINPISKNDFTVTSSEKGSARLSQLSHIHVRYSINQLRGE